MVQKCESIPKVIHYFWFGGKPLPEVVQKCISSWRKFCPDYEIRRWDESNFNISICDYVKEAYDAKKWAFVSDYARFYVLNKYGGLYLDTDVKLIKNLDSIIRRGPFFALEGDNINSLNPGVGMATYPNNPFYCRVLNDYDEDHFIDQLGFENRLTVGERVARFLVDDKTFKINSICKIKDFYIYPQDYFCPLNYFTGELRITENTVAVHLYTASWLSKEDKRIHKIGQSISKYLGRKSGENIEMLLRFPHSFISRVKKVGFRSTAKYYKEKFYEKFK